jgi:hypothetical protein
MLGFRTLNRDDRFCCLGVACEVAIANGVPLNKQKKEFGTLLPNPLSPNDECTLYNTRYGDLPAAVRVWLGFKKGQNFVEFHDALITANDVDGCTFKQIAKIIEAAPDNLWVESMAKKKSKSIAKKKSK